MDQARTSSSIAVAVFWHGRFALSLVAVLAVETVCFSLLQPAGAEVRVSGPADALKIEARNATVDEVLCALQASFRFHSSCTVNCSY